MFWKKKEITVQETAVSFTTVNGEDYISLTDMVRAKEGEFFVLSKDDVLFLWLFIGVILTPLYLWVAGI